MKLLNLIFFFIIFTVVIVAQDAVYYSDGSWKRASELTAPTISISNVSETATGDTLTFTSALTSNLIKVRNTISGADSVHILTGTSYLETGNYYLFQAVHTDTTIIFIDGSNLKLGGNRTLDSATDMLFGYWDGTNFIEIAFINND